MQNKKDRAIRKKPISRKSKKAVPESSDESFDEDVADEIPMYDQRAILNNPHHSPSPVKVSPPLRKSLRHAPSPVTDKPSGSAPKRKCMSEGKTEASTKKARPNVPASTKEQEYDFNLMIDLTESAAYDAKSSDISSPGLSEDVTEMVTKHFAELKKIMKKLNRAVKDKQVLEKMRREANTESKRKELNKEIVELKKALSGMSNDKIEWHSRLKMEVSQLCDRRMMKLNAR